MPNAGKRTSKRPPNRAIFQQHYGQPPYTCYFCGESVTISTGKQLNALVIHHLDEDPWNNDPTNLRAAHNECHSRHHILSPEHRTNLLAALTGHTVSPETRSKISQAKKGKPSYIRTPETLAKQSAAFKGKPLTAETRAKLSAVSIGSIRTPEHRSHIAASWRPAAPRTCECGMVTTPGPMGRHLKATGHRLA